MLLKAALLSVLATIVAAQISSSSTSTSTSTTTSAPCPSGTKISDPTNCRQFYECVNGVKQLSTCPGSSYFNCWSNHCEFFMKPSCCSRLLPPFGFCTNTGDKIANVKNCSQYFECWNYGIIRQSCESGEKFDQWKKTCVAEAEASCASGLPPACKVIKNYTFFKWAWNLICT